MDKKLILTVNESIFEGAEKYAKSNGRSLTNVLEEYLNLLNKKAKEENEFEISPLVKSLWGSVKMPSESKDYKELLGEELTKKYLT